MNWLHPLTDKILAEREFPGEQRRALVLWANELAIICDKHVPNAPAPELLKLDSVLQLVWTLNDRYFSIGITPGLRLLLAMNDPLGTHHQADPTHPELRRNVLCLFDGWKP
jgi:hypothetical protein